MKTLETYLRERHTDKTVKGYLRDWRIFLAYLGEDRASTATYQDVLPYVDYLRKQGYKPTTIYKMLYGVKAYYDYLLHTGQRKDHPCRDLTLKDAKQHEVQLQDLFTSQELEQLLDRKERFESVRVRNQVIVSLLIYQALRLTEVEALRVQDIDLVAGTVHTQGMKGRRSIKTLPRTLKMKPQQVMLFHEYLHQIRPQLLSEETDRPGGDPLLLNIKGKALQADDINYLIETFKYLFPDRTLNARTIRQSVIANLLKEGKDLRVVQAFAGHKKPTATERYRQTGLQALKNAVLKHHPLG